MAIGSDFSVGANGDVRYTGSGTNYTVIAFHRWLGDLMDNAESAGDDYLDITDATASERSTDNIVTLNAPYNIDDVAAKHLYDGSIVQDGGNTIYDGILVFANPSTYLVLLQGGKVVTPNFWTTGLNGDAANGISHRFMLKVRTGGADIDGRRLVGRTVEFGKTYSEFKINGTSRGNNVLALTFANDLNNETTQATVRGWTDVANAEGYQLLDVNNDTVDEPYYSQWDRASRTINGLYERLKWLSTRALVEDSGTDSGTDYAIGDGTITGQAQSFAVLANARFATRVHFRLKKTGTPTGNLVAKVYAHSGVFGTSSVPNGAAVATSVNIDVSKLTTAYQEVEIGFDTQYKMAASTYFCVSLEYTGGSGADYVQVQGAAAGAHAGNRAQKNGTWAADAGSDLWFAVYGCADLYGISGERFRGVTHEIVVDGGTGSWLATDPVSWSGGTGQMLAINHATNPTKMWIQLLSGVAPTNDQVITGTGATATVNVTVTERTLSQPFCGQSTGSALIGAYGLGAQVVDLTASDKLTDLDGNLRVPPNIVTFSVLGLSFAGGEEDRVLVGPEAGGVLDEDQLTLQTSLSGVAEVAVVVTAAIPSDTPAAGTIRIQLNSGKYRRIAYTSWTGSTFTIAPTDFTADPATQPKNVYISYIDDIASAASESFQGVYLADRSLFVRVRNGGTDPIKTFETTGTLGAAGGSATAIRNTDA